MASFDEFSSHFLIDTNCEIGGIGVSSLEVRLGRIPTETVTLRQYQRFGGIPLLAVKSPKIEDLEDAYKEHIVNQALAHTAVFEEMASGGGPSFIEATY